MNESKMLVVTVQRTYMVALKAVVKESATSIIAESAHKNHIDSREETPVGYTRSR